MGLAQPNIKNRMKLLKVIKGQLISKCLFGDFNFFQKTNENTSHSCKNELVLSFFGRIRGYQKLFRKFLNFTFDQEYQTSKKSLYQVIDILEWSEWFQIRAVLL